MNATTTARTYPIDHLIVCGSCGARMTLEQHREPRYACPNSCTAPLEADALNRTVIGGIVPAVLTADTFPMLRAAAARAFAEMQADFPELPIEGPTDEEIRALLNDPGTLMAEHRADEVAGLLGTFIESIEVRPGRATVRYRVALPEGSPAAGSRSQEIELPGPATE